MARDQKLHQEAKSARGRAFGRYLDAHLASSGCILCGYSKCLRALDLHHVGPGKEYVSQHFRDGKVSFDKMIAELKKCVVLCSNCHRETHAGLTSIPVPPLRRGAGEGDQGELF